MACKPPSPSVELCDVSTTTTTTTTTNHAGSTLCQFRHLIDYYEMDARLGIGPVFARHLVQRHYRGEYYVLQIDAHVRFVQDWDTDLIQQWKNARNEMAVLTSYPSDLNDSIDPVTHKGLRRGRPIMCETMFEGAGPERHLRHGQQPELPATMTGQPMLQPFWAAGFSFARGHFVILVPYDQYLPMVFQGEEISVGLRAFTHGYDFYATEHSVCFHMYALKANKKQRNRVDKFWENLLLYLSAKQPAMKRLNTLIGMADWPENEWPQHDKELYTLGQVRNATTFFQTFGIHIEEQTVEPHLCKFVQTPAMMQAFMPALRQNGMGLDYDEIDYKYVHNYLDKS